MMTKPDRYSSVAKALHWTMAFIILSLIPVGFIMHNMPLSSLKFTIYQLHKSFGLIVLVLAIVRLGWRLGHPVPPLPDNLKLWERLAARLTHIGFYGIIVGMPLIGWAMVSSSPTGIPTKIFYTIPVPHFPLPSSEHLYELLLEAHEWMAYGTLALLVLHIGAALKHHFVLKDSVLVRMLPTPLSVWFDQHRDLPVGSKTEGPSS